MAMKLTLIAGVLPVCLVHLAPRVLQIQTAKGYAIQAS